MLIQRPDWTIPKRSTYKIDLSKNVHYDRILDNQLKELMQEIPNFNNYPNEYDLYKSISDYYKIDIKKLAIGFGATDILDRLIRCLDFDTLYIVSPTFEMIEIYCHLINKKYQKISIDQINNYNDMHGVLYIANPSGYTGQVIDVMPFVNNFKYCIIDEVYSDFNDNFSLLHSDFDNVIIVKSLSKSLGLAGIRVGFSKANILITSLIQSFRMNFISNSIATYIVPKVINMTSDVIFRMNQTKIYLERQYSTSQSSGNYVLFRDTNKYTSMFGYKKINGLYRMALLDLETLNEYN
jgi:histidinol-phosphate aminotransferase